MNLPPIFNIMLWAVVATIEKRPRILADVEREAEHYLDDLPATLLFMQRSSTVTKRAQTIPLEALTIGTLSVGLAFVLIAGTHRNTNQLFILTAEL